MFRFTLSDNYSVEAFKKDFDHSADHVTMKFILRDPKKNILIEFEYEINKDREIVTIIPLFGNRFAIIIKGTINKDRYDEEYINDLLIFNAKEGTMLSRIPLSKGKVRDTGGIIYANKLIYVGIKKIIYIYDVKENTPVLIGNFDVEEIIFSMHYHDKDNRLIIKTENDIQSYHLSYPLEDLKQNKVTLKKRKDGDHWFFRKMFLLPEGLLIYVDKGKDYHLSITDTLTDKSIALDTLTHVYPSLSTMLPIGDIAILFFEERLDDGFHIIIYNPVNGNIVDQLQNNHTLNWDVNYILYYIEYVDCFRIATILKTYSNFLPKDIVNLICVYVSCFSDLDLKNMLDWCALDAFRWDIKRSCMTFEKDNKRDKPVYTKEGTQNAKLILQEKKLDNDESKIYDAFKKIYKQFFSNSGYFKLPCVMRNSFFKSHTLKKDSNEKSDPHKENNTRSWEISAPQEERCVKRQRGG